MSYERLLPFRPTNVVHHLGTKSQVPILGGRLLLKGATESGGTLWIPRIPHPAAILALLRAATHQKSVIGFALAPDSTDPQSLRREHSPAAFLHAAVDAAQALDQVPPFLLHVQEPPVSGPQGPEFDAVLDHITRSLEVGFTSFGIDLSACPDEECPAVAAGLLGPVIEMELCVAVKLAGPTGSGITVSDRAYQLAKMVSALDKTGVLPNLVVLPGPEELSADAWQLAEETAAMIAPIQVGFEDSTQVEARQGGPIRALVGGRRLLGMTRGMKDHVDTQRLEALAYMEAVSLIEKLGGCQSALRLLESLAS